MSLVVRGVSPLLPEQGFVTNGNIRKCLLARIKLLNPLEISRKLMLPTLKVEQMQQASRQNNSSLEASQMLFYKRD